jgi:hypothetical protein
MVLVRIAMILVTVLTGVAGLLGSTAEKLPGGGLTVPAACVERTLPGGLHIQGGYCP